MGEDLNDIRAKAEAKYYKIQTDIGDLRTEANNEISGARSDKKTWESWMGAVSFSLAAISGAVLASPLSNYWALLATLIFLITGVSIAIAAKRQYEERSNTATEDIDSTLDLLVKERDVTWDIYMNPSKRPTLNPQLSLINLEKSMETVAVNKRGLERMKEKGIEYSGDIWLGLLTSGIYALIIPTLLSFLGQIKVPNDLQPLIIATPWIALVFFLTIDAVRSSAVARQKLETRTSQLADEIQRAEDFIEKFKASVELP